MPVGHASIIHYSFFILHLKSGEGNTLPVLAV